MLTRLRVHHFMSIKDAELELAPFTVIVGRNRSGKSSMLRALHALCFNDSGNEFITHGEAACSVEVETQEGDVITWNKNKTTATYDLNGNHYSKLAGNTPDDITTALKIRGVVVDNSLTLTPQLHAQHEFFFLVDKTSGQAAKALAKMTRLDLVVRAQVGCKQSLRQIRDSLKVAKDESLRIDEQLDSFDAAAASREDQQLKELDAQQQITESNIDWYDDAAKALRSAVAAREAANVGELPPIHDIKSIMQYIDDMREVLPLIDALDAEVPEPVDLPVAEAERQANRLMEVAVAYRERQRQQEQAYAELKAIADSLRERQQLEQELEGYAGATCPVCGGTL